MCSNYEMHVIPNTHWDREWLYDFQETRMQLIDLFKGLLDMLETYPQYKSFLFDSQVAPVEDYLSVRPQDRERIKRYVESRRILIGPWYTCPEEFNVNGESLFRNLLFGHKVARAFGHVMKLGYSPFSYGQVSQIAQIYASFGIDTILFYHGVTLDEVPSEFILEGADGTRLLGTRMGSNARYNFFFDVYRPAVYGKEISERSYLWREGGMPFHLCGPDDYRSHYFLLEPRKTLNLEKLRTGLESLKKKEIEACSTRVFAYMLGHDSYAPHPMEVKVVDKAAEIVRPDRIFFSSLEEYVRRLKEEVGELPVLKGERRTPRKIGRAAFLYHEVTSSRPRIKRRNNQAENWLQRWAEPFSTIAYLLGEEYPSSLLELAWRYLLRCHPHDSIAGTGIDQIEKDMFYRLDQVINISKGLTRRALQAVQLRIDNSDVPGDEVVITVFNPSPRPRTEVVTAYVDLPEDCKYQYFSIHDADTDREVPTQFFSQSKSRPVLRHLNDATVEMPAERVGVHFLAKSVPGLGYKTFIVRHRERQIVPQRPLARAKLRMENENLTVEVDHDGTLQVIDKKSGTAFTGLNLFIDDGESGMAWRHIPPAYDRAVTSRGSLRSISLVEDGPVVSTVRLDYEMDIPLHLDEGESDPVKRLDGNGDQATRSREEAPLRITSLVSLRKGTPYVEVRTTVDNRCRDHRLRVAFPTWIKTDVCHVESAFDVVRRNIERGEDSPWVGPWNPASPMLNFIDVSTGEVGLAILTEGIREYEVSEDPSRTIHLTLFRAYEVALSTVAWRWERHPEMELSQAPGVHEFRYAIMPHQGAWSDAQVAEYSEALNLPLLVAQTARHEGSLPKSNSFLEIQPPAIRLSAVKIPEEGEGMIIRLYNPTPRPVTARLAFFRKVSSVWQVDGEEKKVRPLTAHDGSVSVELPAKKIISLLASLE